MAGRNGSRYNYGPLLVFAIFLSRSQHYLHDLVSLGPVTAQEARRVGAEESVERLEPMGPRTTP